MPKTTIQNRNESFAEICKDLGERQDKIFQTMLLQYPTKFTARELAREMKSRGLILSDERNMVHPRLNEMVHLGILRVAGKKKDVDMGRNVSVYEIANN